MIRLFSTVALVSLACFALALASGPSTVGAAQAQGTSGPIATSALCDVPPSAASVARLPTQLGEVAILVPDFMQNMSPVQTLADPGIPEVLNASTVPSPNVSFDGYNSTDNVALFGFLVAPPDTEGDVSRDHFVSYNNLGLRIYDKAGTTLRRCPGNVFWADSDLPATNICKTNNNGDPIVLFDHKAKRWVFSQFALFEGPTGDGHQCVAVSTTSDPLGTYHVYDFEVSPGAINDYPKIGMWPDGYYMTTNEFSSAVGNFLGVNITVFERKELLQGDPAQFIQFTIPFTGAAPVAFSLQPSHLEGPAAPASEPNLVIQACDAQTWGCATDGYRFWEVDVDFVKPERSTCTELPLLPTPKAFDSELCGFSSNCIPQPPAPFSAGLAPLGQFTMYRFHNRKVNGKRVGAISHTVDTGGNRAGVRWAQFDLSDPSSPAIMDTGTHAPADGLHRWMPSISMDQKGNIALGYSRSSATSFPSAYYTGRETTDPPMTMQQETACRDGGGSQQFTLRWGDYSTVSIDPEDDCTFWVHQEYIETTGIFNWSTRVCAFSFPSCP